MRLRKGEMMKKRISILVLFLVLLSGIGIVSAETLSGTLSSAGSYVSEQTNITASGNAGVWYGTNLHVVNIEYTGGLASLIHFDYTSKISTYTGEAVSSPGLIQPFTATTGGIEIGHGTIGYQRLYTGTPATEIEGYQYLIFDEWNVTGQTGTKEVSINYNTSKWSWQPNNYGGVIGDHPTGYFHWGGGLYNGIWQGGTSGNVLTNKNTPFSNDWTATKPAGLMIQGNITKGEYGSRVYIKNMDTGSIVASESTVTTDPYSFDVFAGSIQICLFSSGGSWFNTTQLFTGTVTPTPTATPTMTPTPVPTIPPGMIRSTVHVWDQNGNHIHGANIDIKDVENNSWTNSTHDADGISYIDTQPYHTISIYGSYDIFANEFLPNALLSQETGYNGDTFFVTLFPFESSAGDGQTSLFVEVKDGSTHSYIPYAVVQASVSGGTTYVQSTGSGGVATFLVPNQTVIRLSASADGYSGGSTIVNSGTGSTYTTSINLNRQVITASPTSTIPPGGVTPVRTLDSRTSTQKGQAGMDLLASNAEALIGLCIVLTFWGLISMFGKK